ncbi:Ras-related protein Rab-5A [Tritrichomonas foetus]|uniref:Ras-related protein Rab-5A n=1 Tax=Tritrichomonas foetus TaxID=1144522 RepID=A0A1J4J1U0_9EUKA|nr:Ras-related protein Rab-5A [Tritrichomonas foetus]|eukprot:OHS93354.1 Ras-related protein Rab-5A [Tritrichomonas foetus]
MTTIPGQNVKDAKVVMLGSTTVGKSSLVTRLTKDFFSSESVSTIGAAFLSKTLTIGKEQIKLQIWDTSGSERYRAMAPMYYQNADAAVIVYDITSKDSFNDINEWLSELLEKGPPNIIIALVGNKLDLSLNRKINTNVAQEFADKHNLHIFKEASALTGENVNDVFSDIATLIAEGGPKVRAGLKLTSDNPTVNKKNSSKKGGCCK